MYLCQCVCVREGSVKIARYACSFPNMATGLHCAASTFHVPDSTLTDVIPAAKKTVSINKQLLCGIQVSGDHCHLSARHRKHGTIIYFFFLFYFDFSHASSMDGNVGQSVSWSTTLVRSEISQQLLDAMKFCTFNIYGQRIKYTDFSLSATSWLTFLLFSDKYTIMDCNEIWYKHSLSPHDEL